MSRINTKHPIFYAVLFWGVVGFALLLIGDKIIMPVIAGHLKFTSIVPELVGKSGPEAEKLLVAENLLFKWDSIGRYSSTVPAGAVLVQLPEPGRRVKEGRTVHLTVSKGLREVIIPDLRGKSQRQAEISLNRMGLKQGKLIQGAHVSIPRGVVIRTEPGSGKLVRIGQEVDVVISAGASTGKVNLSNLVGLSLDLAAARLDSMGFTLGTVSRKSSEDKLPNTVLEHNPKTGEYLDAGTPVDLVIAD